MELEFLGFENHWNPLYLKAFYQMYCLGSYFSSVKIINICLFIFSQHEVCHSSQEGIIFTSEGNHLQMLRCL